MAGVVSRGDFRASLEALRDRLAVAVDGAEPRELAALARQLSDVLRLLASLPGEEQSELDDLASKREKRRAAVQERPATGSVGG